MGVGRAATLQPWWQRSVIYQIYPRSFADSNGDGVGDLPGITARLSHLGGDPGRSLGVGAVWLSPFYPSPMADFGYDVADYTDVDPVFGTLADFDALVDAAHVRGIKVIIDWVPNHTSDQHPWFIDSRAHRNSSRRDWYVWRDPATDGGPPNNWRSSFPAVGSAWTFDEVSGQYYLHSFTPEQPDLNWENAEVEAAMHAVLRFWLDRGTDGFRIDVVHKLAKDPALRDNLPGAPPRDRDWPTVHERLRRIRCVVDEYRDRVLVGEVWLLDLQRVIEYVRTGDELDLAHNFVFVRLPWKAGAFSRSVAEFEQLSAGAVWPAWFLENHDNSRVPTRYDEGGGSGARRSRLAMMLICTLRGTPFVYQGQELGLPDAEIPPGSVVDVDGRDPERAPLPWARPSEAGPAAGFTSGRPWLPVLAAAEALAVEAQREDSGSTLAFARRLIALRAQESALVNGSQRTIKASPACFCYLREAGDRWLVVLNFTSEERSVELAEDLGRQGLLRLSTRTETIPGTVLTLDDLRLGPDEGVILELPSSTPPRPAPAAAASPAATSADVACPTQLRPRA